MKHYELLEQFYHARGLYLTALNAYVLSKDGAVHCDQTEREYPSYSEDYYLKRVKYKGLYIKNGELIVWYLVNEAQYDTDEPGGGWEEHEDPIEYFSMDELFHITEDIISEEEENGKK